MNDQKIEILRITHLRGPSVWTYRPVMEALVDIGILEDFPSNTLPGFVDRLMGFLPSLIEHRCSYGERGGFLKRLAEGTWAAHILEHVTLELQNLAGMKGGFGKAREAHKRGFYKVVVRAFHEEVSRVALYGARDLIHAAISDTPFDVKTFLEDLSLLAERRLFGPSTASILEAASEKTRKIPTIRMISGGNLVQLGYGIKSRRIWTAETDQTSAIAEMISRDKQLTKTLLTACGVPVPEGEEVSSPEEAWGVAEDIGLPVVVKPLDGNHGRGVFTNLMTQQEVFAAYPKAAEEGSGVIVERFVKGNEHRLLVVGDKLVAAARGETVSVIGDGVLTLEALVKTQINSDPRRGDMEEDPLDAIHLSENKIALSEIARQGYTPHSVPENGREVLIIRTGNHTCDVTDQVHPSVAKTAVLAAKIVGLDIAGVDLVCEDIQKPLREQAGAIVEVNAGPGLLMHLKPENGAPRPVGQAIRDHLFPNGDDGRIPVVGVTGSAGATLAARLMAHFFVMTGKSTGLACCHGLFLNQRRTMAGDATSFDCGERLLMNRSLEAAVFEHSLATILKEGLPYDRCQVGILLNRKADIVEASDGELSTEDAKDQVLRTQIDVVLPKGASILNASDDRLAKMAELSDGEVIYFAADENAAALKTHLSSGKRAVFLRKGELVVAEGGKEAHLIARAQIGFATNPSEEEIEAVLAALAAGVALGMPLETLASGLKTFLMDE